MTSAISDRSSRSTPRPDRHDDQHGDCPDRLADLRAAVPDGVITNAGLRMAGVSRHAIETRCRSSGPWQRLLPGVVLLTGSRPTRRQRARAALAYAGPGTLLTGVDALRAHGIEAPGADDVLVLVPASRRVSSRTFVTTERTTRPPEPVWRDGLPLAPVVRATIDAARRERTDSRLRAVLSAPVRAGACTITQLRSELDAGCQRGSAAVREMLARMTDPVPVALGWARRVVRRLPLPPPRWRVPLADRSGTSLGVADVWWAEAGLVWDVTGVGHTPAERAALVAAGVVVFGTDPSRCHTDADGVAAELATMFAKAATGPRHTVRGCPPTR